MKKIGVIKQIIDNGIVAVVRADSKEKAIKIVDALKKGGIKVIEITMTVPDAIDIIKELTKRCKENGLIIGAGTVLDSETARLCILNGAEFVVSPSVNVEMIKLCNRYGVPVIPGVMTVKEAIEALEMGVDILKVFPGSAFGPSIIKAFKGPIPQGNFMPTGGVSLENVNEWIKAGAVAIGVGGELTKGVEADRYDTIVETAEKFVLEIEKARK